MGVRLVAKLWLIAKRLEERKEKGKEEGVVIAFVSWFGKYQNKTFFGLYVQSQKTCRSTRRNHNTLVRQEGGNQRVYLKETPLLPCENMYILLYL